MIDCRICGKEFGSMITSTHLKSHNMKSAEYKKKFGEKSLTSEEYRKKRSEKYSGEGNPNFGKKHTEKAKLKISKTNKGKEAYNKGRKVTDEKHLVKMKNAARKREEKYKNGELTRGKPVQWTDKDKKKISEAVKKYARENSEKLSERGKKAYQTKVKNYSSTGVIPNGMRGKKHTKEVKQKMAEAARKTNAKRTAISRERTFQKAEEANVTILNQIKDCHLNLKCNTCGEEFTFTSQYFTESKFKKEMCPGCYPRDYNRSQGEMELYDFVKSICPDAIANSRSILGRWQELDIVVPSKMIAFEYNGLYWHSETRLTLNGKDKHHDFHKFQKCLEKGYQPVMIFEDEWKNSNEIAKSRIKHILGETAVKIQARKCIVKEISSKSANKFLKENHIQGSGRSNVRYGLFYNGDLVSVMTFSKENISRRITGWELNRFCSKIGFSVIGGASRLFKRFIKEHNPDEIISYCDRRWGTGELYQKLGFEFSHNTVPNYWYVGTNQIERKSRFSLRLNVKEGDDPNLTEYENRLKQGYIRIWDCGSSKWIWKSDNQKER